MRKVASTFGIHSKLYKQVEQNVIFLVTKGDKDHNAKVDFKEFVTACAKLKKSDPQDFQKFLSVAESQHMLPVGSSCMPTGSTKCAKGSSCLPYTQKKQPPPPPQIYDGMPAYQPQHPDGHLMVPKVPTNRRGTQARSNRFSYRSYRCQVRPNTCEACVRTKGKWFGSHCMMPGGPVVMDAPMTTTVKGCKRKAAMTKAKCSQYKSCQRCTGRGKDRALGQLCAWSSYGKGRCTQNTGGFWGRPMITSSNQCSGDIVHVHG